RSSCKRIGCWSSWTSTPAKSSDSGSNAESSMAWRSAGCSNRRFEAPVCRNVPAPITIRCIDFINGRRISGFSELTEIKTVPYTPWSHPFVERLIGTIRRECLDRLLFWTAAHLEMKLITFRDYYNGYRSHAGLKGETPIVTPEARGASLQLYCWQP